MIRPHGEPIMSIVLSLIMALKHEFGTAIKIMKPGSKEVQEINLHVGSRTSIDYLLDINDPSKKPPLPSLNIGLARLTDTAGIYKSFCSYESVRNDGQSSVGLVQSPSEYMDVGFNLHFNSDNPAVLHYFMSRSVPVLKNKLGLLDVEDVLSGHKNTYRLDVVRWPDGNSTPPNRNNISEARYEIVLRGVEFPVESMTTSPLITEIFVPVHRMDQKVLTEVVDGNLIISIGEKDA